MRYALILLVFLSSSAEASHGDYSIVGTYGFNGPTNPVLGGSIPRRTVPRPTLNPFRPTLVHQDFIWPPFPAKSIPYGQ